MTDTVLDGLILACKANVKECAEKLADSPISLIGKIEWMKGYVAGVAIGRTETTHMDDERIVEFNSFCEKYLPRGL